MRSLVLALLALAAVSSAPAATFTVTTAADSGAGSLRQAILDANSNPGADAIHFDVVGSGVHTIALASSLPTITEAVTIDGYTQPGASPNTNAADQGSNAVIQVEIDGQGTVLVNGPTIAASGVQVRGLSIVRCSAAVRVTTGGSGAVIAGNFIGPDASGGLAPGEQVSGINVANGASDVVVGGLAAGDRNVISGNDSAIQLESGSGHVVEGNLIGTDAAGVRRIPIAGGGTAQSGISATASGVIVGGTTDSARNVISGMGYGVIAGPGMTIRGNFIGTDVTGTIPIPNVAAINVATAGVVIGGSAAGAGNVIAASTGNPSSLIQGGIFFFGSGGNGTTIQGNWIGTDRTGTRALGNLHYGIYAAGQTDLTIGGTGPGEGNVIAFNGGGAGILVAGNGGLRNRIRGNTFYENGTIAIDLASSNTAFGATPNDSGDGDIGGNNLQNYPLIQSVDYGATTTVHASLDSAAGTTYDVDFYSNPTCTGRPPLAQQGHDYAGSTQVTTDGSGNATIDFVLPVVLDAGQPVTATATDPDGNTSELSGEFLVSCTPISGVAALPDPITIEGQAFAPGATVSIGATPATNVVVVDANTITAQTPVLPPGTLYDVTVSVPGGGSGTLANAWVADFLDSSGGFHNDIVKLFHNEITAGVGGGKYGTQDDIKRQSMAVFILKSKHGLCYAPPPCSGVFSDVPCSSSFAPWIEAMAAEGITGGCGGGEFCPLNPVRRDQMAVFLLKGEHGSGYTPPACAGVFTDVPCPSPFADWIEQVKAEAITAGCGDGTTYCPSANNKRGQMATFLVKTFGLQ